MVFTFLPSITIRFQCRVMCAVLFGTMILCHSDSTCSVVRRTSPAFPRTGTSFAVGYHNTTDTIYILGGSNSSRSMVTYSIGANVFSDLGMLSISSSAAAHQTSQYFSYQAHKMYWYSDSVALSDFPLIHSLHFETDVLDDNGLFFANDRYLPCIAAHNDVVFVLGGLQAFTLLTIDSVFAFDTVEETFSMTPTMESSRSDLACAVDAKRGVLYAVGGADEQNVFIDSIETFAIDDDSSSWITLSSSLLESVKHSRAVYAAEDDSIWVIGDTIQRIDCVTGLVSLIVGSESLRSGLKAGVVFVDTTLYIFGNTYDGSWQTVTCDDEDEADQEGVDHSTTGYPSTFPSAGFESLSTIWISETSSDTTAEATHEVTDSYFAVGEEKSSSFVWPFIVVAAIVVCLLFVVCLLLWKLWNTKQQTAQKEEHLDTKVQDPGKMHEDVGTPVVGTLASATTPVGDPASTKVNDAHRQVDESDEQSGTSTDAEGSDLNEHEGRGSIALPYRTTGEQADESHAKRGAAQEDGEISLATASVANEGGFVTMHL